MSPDRDRAAVGSDSASWGDLPLQVKGLACRLGLHSLERNHNSRFVLGTYVLINSAIAIGLLSALAAITGEPFVFPSLGPTAFLLFYAATKPQSTPRNVFLGHLIGVLAGVLALLIFGLYGTSPDLQDVTWPRVAAVTLCLCLTLSVMVWLGVPHAPAGATTLIVGLGLLQTPWQLTVLMIAVLLMIAEAFVINRLAGLPYPLWSRPIPRNHRATPTS